MLAGCLVTTTYTEIFDSGTSCTLCGGHYYACTDIFAPPNPTFTDTSPGTFVSLSAVLTSDNAGTITLKINNVVQGTFIAPMGNGGCYTTLAQCSVVDLIPAVPQTGYVVGGSNTFALTADSTKCFTRLVLMITTAVEC